MKKQVVREGKANVLVYSAGKISKELPVFYNPAMKLNRDISVLLLLALGKKNMRVADMLAGSGVRSIRFAKELPKGCIDELHINDGSKEAVAVIKKNVALNNINNKIKVTQRDANVFLLESKGFEYIDIDPFGSPTPFLDAACRRLSRDGVLAVTATDTAPLCGTYPKTCLRRYWSTPKKCGMMHELGIRILARRVQLMGAQYDKALIPVCSYSAEHYFRIFFLNERGKKAVDNMMKLHGMLSDAGPLWLGQLWDKKLVKSMKKIAEKNKYDEALKLLTVIEKEAATSAAGFHDIHELCKKYKLAIPKKDSIINSLKRTGYNASETHFRGEGVRSMASEQEMVRIIKKLN
jgi:tRNA (guanine26-N2/guanine27-N2)-dimethyltransferase